MYQINLSKIELKELNWCKKKEKKKKIFRRLQCIYLKNEGKTNKEIADIAGACVDTVTDWIKLYKEKGLKGLCALNYNGRKQSKIDPYIDKIKKDIRERMISTLAELQDLLLSEYGIKIEQSWLSRCCKKNSVFLTRKRA